MISSSMPGSGYQPQPMTPASGLQRKLRPGRIWYLVSLIVFAAAAAWLVFGIVSVFSNINSLQRVPLPGGTVSLSHSGGYTVYYEGPGSQNSQPPSFYVRIAPASAGAAVTSRGLKPYGAHITYNLGSHRGVAYFSLQIAHPGTFRVTTRGVPAAAAGGDLAFGGGIGAGIVRSVVVGVPLMGLAFLGGLLVFIIRITRKGSMRRAQPPTGYPGAQPPTGYPGAQPPAGYPGAQPPRA